MRLLDRIFGRSKNDRPPGEINPELAVKIVQDYGSCLASSALAPGSIADVKTLPHPKDRIKQALIFALRITKDLQMRDQLKVGFISLADWQAGVGNRTIGIDTSNLDLSMSIEQQARQVAGQSDAIKKWLPVVKAEQEALKSELQQLGLW